MTLDERLQEILGQLARRSHQSKPLDSYLPLVDDSLLAIKTELLKVLPKKKEYLINNYPYPKNILHAYNQAIDEMEQRIKGV
jgi:hypothetical protein